MFLERIPIYNSLACLFVQAFDSLLRKLQKYVPYGAAVADLYAGAGVIGLSLAATRKCRYELRWFKFSRSGIFMSNLMIYQF